MIKSVLKYAALLSLVALTACGNWALDFDDDFAAAGASFSPLNISNCEMWLDATDSRTLTLDGTAVTKWADKSTANNNATQVGATTTRPTACANQQNGLCTIYFDRNDYLATDYLSVDGQTVFIVAKVDSGEYILGSRDTANSRSYFGLRNGTYIGAGVGTQIFVIGTARWGSAYHLLECHYNGLEVTVRADGIVQTTQAQSGTGENQIQGYYVGAMNNMSSPAGFFAGNVGEIIIYKRVLGGSEIMRVESYLMEKWGIK